MEWKKSNNISKITQEDFTQFRKQYPLYYEDFDKQGRPGIKSHQYMFNVSYSQNFPFIVAVQVMGLWNGTKL